MKNNGEKSAKGPHLYIYEKSTLLIEVILVLFLIFILFSCMQLCYY